MQLVHADVADLQFFSKSVVAPKYCFVCIDLFTSKTYTYGMKKSKLPVKLEKFYSEIEHLRVYLKKENRDQMRIQTDQEFNQNEITSIDKKYHGLHYNSKLNEEHAVAVKQKICELKIRLRIFKRLLNKGKLKPNKVLKKVTANMNLLPTRKCGVAPEEVEKKSHTSEEYKLTYDFKLIFTKSR